MTFSKKMTNASKPIRLFGLASFEWSVLLGGSVLCGLLTLLA